MSSPTLRDQVRLAPSWRLAWLIPAGIALLSGLDAALLLLGVSAPVTTTRLPQVHGMLLAIGFVGTLIALERATAWGRWYGFVAPALLGLSAIALIADPVPLMAAKIAMAAGAAAFTLLYIPLWQRQYDAIVLTELLGAGLAMIAAILWIGEGDLSHLLPWLIGYIVLTIGAERVELARITMGNGAGRQLLLHAWSIVIALTLGLAWPTIGDVALGVALLLFVGWLVTHDIARRTIHAKGVTRYMAACILSGYVWLFVAAATLLLGQPNTQPAYDTVVHAVFLGYTFSMIMAHATTILPAVLHIALPYRPLFWVPFGMLQLSLLVRLWFGDGFGVTAGFQIGGVLGVTALLLFVLASLSTAILGARRAHTAGAAPTRSSTIKINPARTNATGAVPTHTTPVPTITGTASATTETVPTTTNTVPTARNAVPTSTNTPTTTNTDGSMPTSRPATSSTRAEA